MGVKNSFYLGDDDGSYPLSAHPMVVDRLSARSEPDGAKRRLAFN